MHAAEMAAAGESAQNILTALAELQPRIKLLVMFDTLKNLRKGGRVSALTAGLGDLLQVKLMVDIHTDEFHQLDKVRTRSRGLERLVDVARSNGPFERMAVISAGAPAADVAMLHDRLADLLGAGTALTVETTPGLGAHTGVGAIGISVVKKAR
jgi:DegV family protein with EDD domain